jgi:hypothetical protein
VTEGEFRHPGFICHAQPSATQVRNVLYQSRAISLPRLDVWIRSACPCCPQGCRCHESGITYKYCPTRPIEPQLHIPGAGLLVQNPFTVVLSSFPFPFPKFLSFCPLHCWHGGKTPLFVSSCRSWSRDCPSWYVCKLASDSPCSLFVDGVREIAPLILDQRQDDSTSSVSNLNGTQPVGPAPSTVTLAQGPGPTNEAKRAGTSAS